VSALSDRDVLRIAELARLALTEDERRRLGRELAAILTYVEQVGAIDTTGIEPTSHVQLEASTLRADVPQPSLRREDALANAPDAARGAGLFKVPKVIG
jgi:aspartyl-tRNA(Asn)/glutamyl-tRNA(Gln) amidotransferase subunit C